jgi:hypothetical protein
MICNVLYLTDGIGRIKNRRFFLVVFYQMGQVCGAKKDKKQKQTPADGVKQK